MTICCVFKCKNIGTHSFPNDIKMKNMWLRAIRRGNFKPTKWSRLCRDHFLESDYQDDNCPAGVPQMVKKFLKITAVPSIFPWNKRMQPERNSARAERLQKRNIKKRLFVSASMPAESAPADYQEEVEIPLSSNYQIDPKKIMKSKTSYTTIGTQTPFSFSLFTTNLLLTDDKSVIYFTGLESKSKFLLVLSTLLPMAYNLKYRWHQVDSISIEDQFLLMVIKLRTAKPDFEISKMFNISTTQVSNIFTTFCNFVYDIWSLIDIWPRRDLVRFYMPEEFKKTEFFTRIIIDCTEIPIAKPSNPLAQKATFSSYKNRNTLKFLIGSTPGGLLCYCSKGYGGSTSDRQMIERSDLLEKCEPGDSIMADRGFNVQDLFAHKDISLNIPSFLKGKHQLPGIKLLHDRKIASQRVQIERLIGLTKTYKILKIELNAFYVPLASKIVFICVMLCNFRESINKQK